MFSTTPTGCGSRARGTSFDQAVANTRALDSSGRGGGRPPGGPHQHHQPLGGLPVSTTSAARRSPRRPLSDRRCRMPSSAHSALRRRRRSRQQHRLAHPSTAVLRRCRNGRVPRCGRCSSTTSLAIAVDAGSRKDDLVIDAVGPETFTFDELVGAVASAIGRRVHIVHVRPAIVLGLAKGLGLVVRDVMLTAMSCGA